LQSQVIRFSGQNLRSLIPDCCRISLRGNRRYSERAGGAGANDIWASTRTTVTAPWSTPVAVTALNTSFGEIHPALDLDGLTIYFASNRPGGSGGNDLYMATRTRR
jgi:WD40-like Beta Propeller Repeat